jgi:hypothetical protein
MAFLSRRDVYSEYVNHVGFIPSMLDVQMKNAFLASIAPLNRHFRLAFERVFLTPKGIGKFGGFQPRMLKSLGGPVSTAKDLADLSQKDWDDAMKANQ